MVVGLNVQVVPAEQASEMVPVKLLGPFATRVKVVCVEPMSTGLTALGEVSVKAAAPVPVSNTACGLPVALSVILNCEFRVPLAVGEKVTLTVQLWLTPSTP